MLRYSFFTQATFVASNHGKMERIVDALKADERTIVDVRTPMEFMGGHVSGSINIPLMEIPERLGEFRNMKNIVLCCASGNRSGQATQFLMANGIECLNGGSWLTVNHLVSQLQTV